MKKLKLGLVGLGEVAQIVHLPALAQLDELFEISALCDASPRLLQAIGERHPEAERYGDARELARDAGLDAVLILNSSEYHAEGAIAAIESGKHVLIEKPMCMTVREADEIIAAKNRAGVKVMVGYMRRYAAAFEQAAELVRGMEDVTYARVRDIIGPNAYFINQSAKALRFELPESVREDRRLRGERLVREAIGEGAPPDLVAVYHLLLGLGSHDLSAMRELIGLPQRIVSADCWLGGTFLSVLFDHGRFRTLFEMGLDGQGRFDALLEVMNETQTVKVTYDTPYIRHLPAQATIMRTAGESFRTEIVRPTYEDPYTRELRYFHESIVQDREPKTSAEDAREDLVLFRQIIDTLRHKGERPT
ncbi:Gfo/Idh/MocA family protein [Cohnella cellulosilytica]|uniref:Gfo/Idh/MocA family protein n=1 Tax=Cohnella cellulosilytica TaxID=986710 RepID=A0ABW2FLR2_9BACL